MIICCLLLFIYLYKLTIARYMSPERIQNGPYSYMSDIWSFGLVMHECATGRYPFQDKVAPIDMATIIIEAHGKYRYAHDTFCCAHDTYCCVHGKYRHVHDASR